MITNDPEHWIELLKLYYDEWKFREEDLWKKAVQMLIVIFFTSTLPITIGVFGGVNIGNIPLYLFPVSGILLTIFFLVFYLSNSLRIKAVDQKRRKIISMVYGHAFSSYDLPPLLKKSKKSSRIFRARITIWVPVVLSLILLGISIAILVMIHKGLIVYTRSK